MNDKIKFKKKSKEKKLRFPSKGEIKNYLVLPISVFYLKYLDSRHTKVAILIKQKKKKKSSSNTSLEMDIANKLSMKRIIIAINICKDNQVH